MKQQIATVLLGASILFGTGAVAHATEQKCVTESTQFEDYSHIEEFLDNGKYDNTNKYQIYNFTGDVNDYYNTYHFKQKYGFTNGVKIFYKTHNLKRDSELFTFTPKTETDYLFVYDYYMENILEIIEIPTQGCTF